MSLYVLKYVGSGSVCVSEVGFNPEDTQQGVNWLGGGWAVVEYASVKDEMLATDRWTLHATLPTIG